MKKIDVKLYVTYYQIVERNKIKKISCDGFNKRGQQFYGIKNEIQPLRHKNLKCQNDDVTGGGWKGCTRDGLTLLP